MKRLERIEVEVDMLEGIRDRAHWPHVNGTMAVPAETEDPEDEQPGEESGLDIMALRPEEPQKSERIFGRSSYEEDFSDSQLWEETFEVSPAWRRKAKAEQEEEELAFILDAALSEPEEED